MDVAEQEFSPRKLAALALVALLHVGIIYAFITGLGEQAVQVLRAPLEAKIIQEVKPPQVLPPPPPPPMLAPPPPFIPPPLVQIAQPPPPVPVIAAVTTVKPVTPPPQPRAAQVVRSGPVFDPNQTCAATTTLQNDLGQAEDEDPDMPAPGRTVFQFLVGADGHVVKAIIASPSGNHELDADALQALPNCTFKPGIGADGKPIEAWFSMGYVWQMN